MSITIIGSDYSAKQEWNKGLGNYSCLVQMDGCGLPSPLVAPICIPSAVNTDVQNPFTIKMPNI